MYKVTEWFVFEINYAPSHLASYDFIWKFRLDVLVSQRSLNEFYYMIIQNISIACWCWYHGIAFKKKNYISSGIVDYWNNKLF
jgi:hypothetical protein